ncbi:MAG TPA: alpha/beta hydrolase [Chloroflexia bacterium]|nr:alpha/beta hydrolase [Chloroflexia bacterium]
MSTQYLNLTEGKIAYDDQGAGPLVVCLPSMGDVRGEYRFLAPRLVEAGYRVVTMDVRGHGESSARWSDYTVGAWGSDIIALIKHLNAGPALVVGTSMGAAGAVYAAAEAPELVSAIVLVGPFVRVMGPKWQALTMANLVAFPLWGVAFWGAYYRTLYPTAKPADFEGYVANLKQNLKEPGRLAALRGMLSDLKTASDERLAKVEVPVHIIMGSKDRDFKSPEKEVQNIVERLTATRPTTQIIPDAGHYPHAEMPEATAQSILGFFSSINSTSKTK